MSKTVNIIGFIDLVKKYEKIDSKFNLEKRLELLTKDDFFCEDGRDKERDAIAGMLPGVNLIFDDTKYNLILRGEECWIKSKRLYSYRDYYLFSKFNSKGNDMHVSSYTKGARYSNGILGFYDNIKVFDKKDFDLADFLRLEVDVLTIINFYKCCGEKGKKILLDRIEKEWE